MTNRPNSNSKKTSSVGERLDALEKWQQEIDLQMERLEYRLQYLDVLVQVVVSHLGVEKVQQLVDERTQKVADDKMRHYSAELEQLVAQRQLAPALVVGPRSIILCSFLPAPGRIPEPRRLRADMAPPLLGKEPGDVVGQYTVLTVYDPVPPNA